MKAFVYFGEVSAELQEEGPVSAEEEDNPAGLVELLQDPEDAEEDEPEAVEVDEDLHNHGATSILPAHMRCAAHTFNLIACKDSKEALKMQSSDLSAGGQWERPRLFGMLRITVQTMQTSSRLS